MSSMKKNIYKATISKEEFIRAFEDEESLRKLIDKIEDSIIEQEREITLFYGMTDVEILEECFYE